MGLASRVAEALQTKAYVAVGLAGIVGIVAGAIKANTYRVAELASGSVREIEVVIYVAVGLAGSAAKAIKAKKSAAVGIAGMVAGEALETKTYITVGLRSPLELRGQSRRMYLWPLGLWWQAGRKAMKPLKLRGKSRRIHV